MYAIDGRIGAQIESENRRTKTKRRIMVGTSGFKNTGLIPYISYLS